MGEVVLRYENDVLHVDGLNVEMLVGRLPTPFFLVSTRHLLANLEAIRQGLGAAGRGAAAVRYCAKTNNEVGVLEQLAAAGSHVLASHVAEVELALRCGFSPETIAYQRPVLLDGELREVLAHGVRHVHLHRPGDLTVIAAAARATNAHPLKLSFRLRPHEAFWSPLGQLRSRVGFAPAELAATVRAARREGLDGPLALNAHLGTQQRGPGPYRRFLYTAADLAAQLERDGSPVAEINIGGGLPSPTLRPVYHRGAGDAVVGDLSKGRSLSALEGVAYALARLYLHALRRVGVRSEPILTAEPGRAVVGNAVVLVTRVVACASRWIFVDASRNHLGESPLRFSRAVLPARHRARRLAWHHLSGPTLNTMDVLDMWRRIPSPDPGEVLVLADAGAYSISRATRYGGLCPAVHLVTTDGRVRTVRYPEGLADLLGTKESTHEPPFARADVS